MTAPWSTTPYVANASLVAGVYTGSDTSWASAWAADTAATRMRAVPGDFVRARNRTATRSLAGTTIRRPAEPTSSRLEVCTTTSTSMATSVWFWTTIGISNSSP